MSCLTRLVGSEWPSFFDFRIALVGRVDPEIHANPTVYAERAQSWVP